MEQARKGGDLEKEEDRSEVLVAAKAVRIVVKVVTAEVVLGQVRVDSAFVPTAVKKQPMNWEVPVMSRNVPNAERP